MKAIRVLTLTLTGLMFPLSGGSQNAVDIKPTPQQSMWQDLEFGVIIHFGTNTFLDREWGDGTADPNTFDPEKFDPNQWMDAIAASGAKYVVLVAKHHDGFCLWPTEQTKYGVASSAWRGGHGDVVGEVAKAARSHGLRFGIYLSPWDRHEPKYKDAGAYDAFYKAQLTELASRYGDLVELWLDGAGSTGRTYDFAGILETLRTYQPNTVVFADAGLLKYADARWAGDESGKIEYENWNVLDRNGYLRWRPIEIDTPLRKLHWFWHPNDEASLKSSKELLDSYENSVGKGGQWMLGVAPDRNGLLPASDMQRLVELGDALRKRYGQGLLDPSMSSDTNVKNALDDEPDTVWQAPPGSHESFLEIRLPNPVTFNSSLTMEWLVEGQQVQHYAIEIQRDGQWKTVTNGFAIGHKKIDKFEPVTAQVLRLHILSSAGSAHIRRFQIFNIR